MAPIFTGNKFGFGFSGGSETAFVPFSATGGTVSNVVGTDGVTYRVHTGPFPAGFTVNSASPDAYVFVELTGGGASGGTGTGGGSGGGGGGGGGGFVRASVPVSVGTCTISIGGGAGPTPAGPPGGGSGNVGNSGGTSTFTSTTGAIVNATGGSGGGSGTYQGSGGGGGSGGSASVSGGAVIVNQFTFPGTSGGSWQPGPVGSGANVYPSIPNTYVLYPTPMNPSPFSTNAAGSPGTGGGSNPPSSPGNPGFCRIFYPTAFL